MRCIPATGQRSASFICTQFDQNNYANDLWTHYLIYFIRLSGSFELHNLHWLLTGLLLQFTSSEKNKKVRSHLKAYQPDYILPRLPCIRIYSHWNLTPMSARAFSHLFIVRLYRWKKGVQHFRGKWLAVNIDCHHWESKRERNERKQVHLPQVYNPEITVCSGTCLTALWAACASLLISSAPAVQELIWRFSESITLLSKVPLPERYTHTCTAHMHPWKINAEKDAYMHTHANHSSLRSKHSFTEGNYTTSTRKSWARPCTSLWYIIQTVGGH